MADLKKIVSTPELRLTPAILPHYVYFVYA
jgi:hypothetical protein